MSDFFAMIFKKLKRRLYQNYFQKELDAYVKKTRNFSESPLRKVALLVDEYQLYETNIAADLQKKLGLSPSDIDLLIFRSYNKKEKYSFNEITERDFAWSGSLKLNKLRKFVKYEYDLLINYGFEENLYLKMITLRSRSRFKVGFSSFDSRMYDLSVHDVNRDVSVLNAEAEKYLKILKKTPCKHL